MEKKVSNYRNIYCSTNLLFIICFFDKLDSKEIKEFSEIMSNRYSEKIKI